MQTTTPQPTYPSDGVRRSKSGDQVRAGACTTTERRLHTAPPPPPNLQPVPRELEYHAKRQNLLDAQALQAYVNLVQAARRDGIQSPYLKLVSGFRDYDLQAGKWKGRLLTKFEEFGCPKNSLPCIGRAINRTNDALRGPSRSSWPMSKNAWLDKFLIELKNDGCNLGCDPRKAVTALRKGTAPPGSSPHHTGRAMDLYVGGEISTASKNVAYQQRLNPYKWLVCNAAKFNFYPYAPEPWHWEYNPA
jgi:hypothetical protein